MTKLLICFFLFWLTVGSDTFTQNEKVSIEIINEDGSKKTIQFEWPFKGPPPVGDKEDLPTKVNSILISNEIVCPPKREKVSENIWKCGNGKKIRSNDEKLTRLLNKVWN